MFGCEGFLGTVPTIADRQPPIAHRQSALSTAHRRPLPTAATRSNSGIGLSNAKGFPIVSLKGGGWNNGIGWNTELGRITEVGGITELGGIWLDVAM